MANEVAKRGAGGALAAAAELKGALRQVRDSVPNAGGTNFLRFLQDGNWVFGQSNTELTKGVDEVAVNPLSLEVGFNCWTDRPEGQKNELLDEITVPLTKIGEKPLKHQLPDHGDKLGVWRDYMVCQMKVLTGPHKGKSLTYGTNSVGGIGLLQSLLDQILVQLDEDPERIVPVVTVDSDHYQHKKWGRTYTPEYDIVRFVSMDGDSLPAVDGEDDPEPREEPRREEPRREEPPRDEQKPPSEEPVRRRKRR